MGLNYVPRPRREDLNPPNDFITVSLGYEEQDYANHDDHLILQFYKEVLDDVEAKYKNLRFDRTDRTNL